jgi:hypothetical protein
MPNLPEGHSTLVTLEERFEEMRAAFLSGTRDQQIQAMSAFAHQMRYTFDAAEVSLHNATATQSPTDLTLFGGEEVAQAEAPESD